MSCNLLVSILSMLFVAAAVVDGREPWIKAENKSMLPEELRDVFDFDGDGVKVYGFKEGDPKAAEITYVLEKDKEVEFMIGREPLSKCNGNVPPEKKMIKLCYKSTPLDFPYQKYDLCEQGKGLYGFLFEEFMFWPPYDPLYNPSDYRYRSSSDTATSLRIGIDYGEEKSAKIIYWDEPRRPGWRIIFQNNHIAVNNVPRTQFEGDENLLEWKFQVWSTNLICGWYFKFRQGFFPIYNYIEETTTSTTTTSTTTPAPTPPPTTISTATPPSTQPSDSTNLSSSSSAEGINRKTSKDQLASLSSTTTATEADVAESEIILWVLSGIGILLIILLLAASVYCLTRGKFNKKPKQSKEVLTDKLPESLPPSSDNMVQSSEAVCNVPVIAVQKPQESSAGGNGNQQKGEIKSSQTAIPPPEGLRGLKNADEFYRLAITAETREERNIYLDAAIENANEDLQIWQRSAPSQSNDTSTLPCLAKRILNAKKTGVKLIPTKDPTKLIPEQMDGLTYEQINDLALIETYPNVRYALFERAAEQIKRAFDDSAPDAHFDKDNIEPLLYQYQLGLHEVNEEPPQSIEKRNKYLDEILKKMNSRERAKMV